MINLGHSFKIIHSYLIFQNIQVWISTYLLPDCLSIPDARSTKVKFVPIIINSFWNCTLKAGHRKKKYKCMLALVSCNLSTNMINCKIKIYQTNDRKVRSRTSQYGHSLNSDTSLLRTLFFVPEERKPLMLLSPHFPSGMVVRAKRERAWKSPQARKARRGEKRFDCCRLFHTERL